MHRRIIRSDVVRFHRELDRLVLAWGKRDALKSF